MVVRTGQERSRQGQASSNLSRACLTWKACETKVSDSAGLGWGSKFCIPTKF